MHLKKLVVSGFKSFADKVTLNFDRGITGIVGPNGSGKSNVIDSVRWVMGEQNAKHLRGQVATDIIFAGSHKRKPLGMAEVSLIFDNSEFSSFCPPEYRHESEIVISRRLYASGEREYFINRKQCRLKDIVGFFAATGLGGRSYSMIQQGQVDRILNAKPEDVREIIEEAAGTMVFKNRRLAAQKKLDATIDNMSRLNDIVVELERQLEALESQVEKAEAWQSLSGELKVEELSYLAHGFFNHTANLQALALKLEGGTQSEISLSSEIGRLDLRVQELQQALAEADPELDQIREDIAKLREQIARAEGSITSAMAAEEDAEKRLIEIDELIASENIGFDALQKQLEQNMEDSDKAQEEYRNCQAMIDSFIDEVDQVEESAQVFENRSGELEDQLRNLERLLESNGLRCESIERERSNLVNDIAQKKDRLHELRSEMGGSSVALESAEEELEKRKSSLDRVLASKESIQIELDDLADQLKELRSRKDEERESFLSRKSRIESIHHILARPDSIAEVLEQLQSKSSDSLAVGVLSDAIKYREAASELTDNFKSVFEMWAERLIVPSMTDLDVLQTCASETETGLIPISVGGQSSTHDLSEYGMKKLSDFIEVASSDEIVASSSESLLSRLYVLEPGVSLEDCRPKVPAEVVLFTLDGVVYNGSSECWIGSASGSNGALSLKSELELLEKQVANQEVEVQSIADAIVVYEEQLQTLKGDLVSTEERIKKQNAGTIESMSKLQSVQQRHSHMQDLIDEAESFLQQMMERDRNLTIELEGLGEARISIAQEKDTLNMEIESLRDEFASIDDRREEVRRMKQGYEIDLAKFETKVQALKNACEQSSEQLDRVTQTKSLRTAERAKIEVRIEESINQRAINRQEMEAYLYRRDELEEELNVRREKSSDILDELKSVEDGLKQKRKSHAETVNAKIKDQGEMERLRTVVKGLIEQAQEKYQVELIDYRIDIDPDFDGKKSQKKVQSLREKIEDLGGINMVAIEEYKRLKERYDFIQSQKDEVEGSILLLEEAISEIEDTSREKFSAIFEVVNKNFAELFPILFPGGEARLQLQEDEDVLNAGVEIMVRMPGKTPRSMTLYSGGEKALTAISLIFALLKTKPTPFCFLDEVDAPLDEANVGRYNRVLEALSDRFQFVVITHNRRTMEVLDQLYGVTMQEGGVSTVVGVDMKKDLPDHLKKSFAKERSVEGASAQ